MKDIQTASRFDGRVANYAKFRPGYPDEVLNFLINKKVLRKNQAVAEIGSGTGIFTKLLLEHGFKVKAVEPNDEMRSFASDYLKSYSDFKQFDGTGENTGLEDCSVEAMFFAQSFHWMDPQATKKECGRVLKGMGPIVVLWNERDHNDDDFSEALEHFVEIHSLDYSNVRHREVSLETNLKEWFSSSFKKVDFPNLQTLSFEGLLGRLASSSYMPNQNAPAFGQMKEDLKQLFEKFEHEGFVTLTYKTRVYFGSLE